MNVRRFSNNTANESWDNLLDDYALYAPVKKEGDGRLSDTDLLTYDYTKSLSQVEFDKRTFFSPKSVLFPVRETLFECTSKEMLPVPVEAKSTIVLVRACDTHAIKILDQMFLKNGGVEDPSYKKRRENLKIFLIVCKQSFEGCFCKTFGTDKAEGHDGIICQDGNDFIIATLNEEFDTYFSQGEVEKQEPISSITNQESIPLPEDIDLSLFTNDMWQEYSKRCIGCGRCNTSCPTCTCFTIQNTPSQSDSHGSQRKQIWSSCQVKGFGLLTKGHDFRLTNGERMRYKVLHKIVDFQKRHGIPMCVGCGRCEEVCPEYISMGTAIRRVSEVSNTKGAEQ